MCWRHECVYQWVGRSKAHTPSDQSVDYVPCGAHARICAALRRCAMKLGQGNVVVKHSEQFQVRECLQESNHINLCDIWLAFRGSEPEKDVIKLG
jgi:hypothetical protein